MGSSHSSTPTLLFFPPPRWCWCEDMVRPWALMGSGSFQNKTPHQKEFMDKLIIVSRMEIWPIERLIPYGANARTHSKKQVWQIARSMREHGVINPVLVDEHGNVI